ncbi:MAG TPA: cell wall-binding repeat-containing protein [Nocardioidaceae bacterium]|nr:cell wall-binding repeat-containing protein [Nocardioidaceae bacterium]
MTRSRASRIAAVAVVAAMAAGMCTALVAAGGSASALPTFSFDRVAGSDRYATSVQVSTAYGDTTTAILVNGSPGNYADALSATYLSGARNAPILLTRKGYTPKSVQARLKSSGVKTIVIVGGTGVVAKKQAEALRSAGYTVSRIAGKNRYATDAKVLASAGKASGSLGIVATGQNFPDALAAGPLAYGGRPLGLATQNGIADDVVSAMKAAGVTEVLVMGGTQVVGAGVVATLKSHGIDLAQRFAGSDRAETSTLAATYAVQNLGFSRTAVDVASGYQKGYGADALAGGPLAGKQNRPLLITKSVDQPGDSVLTWLQGNALTLLQGSIFGGTGAVSADAASQMEKAASGLSLPLPTLPPLPLPTVGPILPLP